MSTLAAYKPGTKMEQVSQLGMDVVVFKTMGVFTKSAAVTSMNWAINANTELAEEAMKVLNLFYTDAEAATLLAWGEEGVDYKKTDDGFLTYADGIDASNQQYSTLNWLIPWTPCTSCPA